MCYEVKCPTCGKTSWAGCGLHVTSVYRRIPEGQHCLCKAWPGVRSGSGSGDASEASSSSCSVL